MLSIFQHEFKFYFKNKQEAVYLYSFFVSVILLIPFTLTPDPQRLQELASSSLWVALACAVAMGGQSLFRRDYEQGLLEYYQLLPIALEGVIFAKWLAFYIFLLLPLYAALPIAMVLYGLPITTLIILAIGVSAGAAALSILATSLAALMAGLAKAGATLSLIMLPISIPLLIFGAAYTQNSTSIWQPNLIFLLGFSAFMMPIMCLAGAYSIRNAN